MVSRKPGFGSANPVRSTLGNPKGARRLPLVAFGPLAIVGVLLPLLPDSVATERDPENRKPIQA
jgi:hypothetical protein